MQDFAAEFGQGGLNEQLSVDDLMTECGLDESEIEWRKGFIGFDETDADRLSDLEDVFRTHADAVADDFYDNLTSYEETVEVIGRSEKTVEQLKRTQSAYLISLAAGDYGLEYFRNRARIGKLHNLLEMPMKHYIGQYGVYYDLLVPLLLDRMEDRLADRLLAATDATDEAAVERAIGEARDATEGELLATLRAINLDMQVVADTYIHSYSQKLQDTIEERERLIADVEADLAAPIGDLRDSVEQVSERTTSIDERTDDQVGSMSEVAGEVSNMSATVEEIASTADEVAATSERAADLAAEGQEAATESIAVMEQVSDASRDVAGDVDALESRIDEIDEVVEVINDIADQTNLLALNASIEAARAGEAGEGFAVVADEVKSLAGESQRHASDVEEMVGDIKTETAETVESLETTTKEIDRGMERIESAMSKLEDIVDAVQDASRGIREVSEATDDQAASTEEVASMIDGLVDQAEHVSAVVERVAEINGTQTEKIRDIDEAVQRLGTD